MNRPTQLSVAFSVLVLALALAPGTLAVVCVQPDDGSGTAQMPPDADPANANCTSGYLSPSGFHEIINGLPPGATIQIGPEHSFFLNVTGTPGGNLGGQRETFDSQVVLQMNGTGDLAGFNRQITVQLQGEAATGPRVLGADTQTFPNEMVQLQGEIFGDPDFDQLSIRAGSFFGLPSPGQTTLTRLPSGDFNVDSFFDITYEIDFVGAPGSILAGSSGTTQGTVRMQIGNAVQATPGSNSLGLIIAGIALIVLLSVVMVLRRRPRMA